MKGVFNCDRIDPSAGDVADVQQDPLKGGRGNADFDDYRVDLLVPLSAVVWRIVPALRRLVPAPDGRLACASSPDGRLASSSDGRVWRRSFLRRRPHHGWRRWQGQEIAKGRRSADPLFFNALSSGSNAKLKCPVDRHGAHSNHGCVVGFDLPARPLPEPHPFDDSSPVAGVAHARGQPESGADLHDVLEEREKRSIQCLPLHHKCEILGNPLTFPWS